MRRAFIGLIALTILSFVSLIAAGAVSAGRPATTEKVTICHARGLAGTTKFVTISPSVHAVYKRQGGHFFENGTPRAGHEQDYFGACITETTPTPTPSPSTDPTPEPTASESPIPSHEVPVVRPSVQPDVPDTAMVSDDPSLAEVLVAIGLLALLGAILLSIVLFELYRDATRGR